MKKDLEKEKYLAAKEAVKLICDGQIVGLGTGSTTVYAVKEIGAMVKEGLSIQGVPTSDSTKELALELGIKLIDINKVEFIDVTIDGADEFTTDGMLIKGGGGALLKEKIVASMTRKEIIIADSSKKVDKLGRFPLPVEVIPFAANYVMRQLMQIQGIGKIRMKENKPFVTDEGNHIIDTDFGLINEPVYLSEYINNIAGVAGHGLFIKLSKKIIMGDEEANTVVVYEFFKKPPFHLSFFFYWYDNPFSCEAS